MGMLREENKASGKQTVLHVCCGPCASACVPRLKDAGREVTMLFANSNIDTAEEFEHRRAEAERLAAHDGVAFASLPYDHADWLEKVAKGFEDAPEKGGAGFLPEDFKKREGFKLSVARAKELGLYRQAYCVCEFSRRGTRPSVV